jgi:primary-amine oxidase
MLKHTKLTQGLRLLLPYIPGILASFVWVAPPAIAHAARHPFDDLDAGEVKQVVKIIRDSGQFSSEVRFPVVRMQEPPKRDWLEGKAAQSRLAYAAVFDYASSLMSEVVIDLRAGQILQRKDLPNIKPPVLIEEYARARKIILAHPGWQAGVLKRGLKLEDVLVDLWAPGLLSPAEQKPGQRLLRAVTYLKKTARNFYSRPVEGLIVTVDLSKGAVAQVWDEEVAPVADGFRELGEKDNAPLDPPFKRLSTSQPDGPSYQIHGQEIRWHRWRFRYSMDPLQGLKLYHVRYDDPATGSQERSILYQISLAEMLVPYGGLGKAWTFRNAFDVGEYGLGKTLHPMVAGKDAPVTATLLDSVIPDDLGGDPLVIKGAALYERDSGLLWKHRNAETGETDIRRGRQLVLGFMTTIGNYDYGINYVFHLDGTISVDAQLTGILLARGSVLTRNPCDFACKPLVEKNVIAPPHQHFFNFRIDLDVDGADGNSVAEVDVKAVPKGPENPAGNAFGANNTVLTTEKGGMREHAPEFARKWKVFNPGSRNLLSHPRGYALMPGETAVPYLHRSSQIRARAQFINHPIWVTQYKDGEMSAAATYPTTAPAGEGLPRYVSDNEKIDGRDVVLWYTFGVTHIPRVEEWPIMNVHHTGFTLMPMNFFSQNPAMTVRE